MIANSVTAFNLINALTSLSFATVLQNDNYRQNGLDQEPSAKGHRPEQV